MGTILYDGTAVDFEDRLLQHLQIVIVQKFSKNESFLMSWRDGHSVGDGRASIWLAPTIAIYFKFLGSKVPDINRNWLLELGKSADSSTGLIVTDEQGVLAGSFPVQGDGHPGNINTPRR